MKKNNYYLLLCGVVLILGAGSCKKQLTEYNPSGLTATTVSASMPGFEALVDAAYTYTRFWYGKEEGYSLSEMGTDIWTSGSGDVYPQLTQYNNLQGSNTVSLNLEWNNFYAAVNLCNLGIANIANVPGYTAPQRAIREGELRFLRAFYYWHIVETWGGVNFATTPSTGVVTTANKTPVDTFYNQIFTDLQFAVANLPKTTTDYGRATVPVAKAFLARMYLTRGLNAQAAALSEDVIKNYGYVLQPKYVDLWNMGNLKNKEVIWVVDYSTNLANNDIVTATYPYGHTRGSNSGHLLWIMVYDQVNATVLLRDVNGGRPFNRYMPTEALMNLYDLNNDSRFAGSFQTLWTCNKAGTVGANVFHLGDTVAWAPNATIATPSTKYTTYDLSRVYGPTGVPSQRKFYASLSKFKDSTRASVNEAQSARDVFVIRLAEMYLIAGEAQMKLGNLDSAAYYINFVRTRAAIPGHEAAMQVAPAQVNIDFILDERARELSGEQLRWFDLKRTGKLVSRVTAMNPDAAPYIKITDTVRPIPQSQLDAETNKDVLTQNPGYN